MTRYLDLILKGNILTMSNSLPRAGAVGVKDGHIAAVGAWEEINEMAGPDSEQLDVSDQTVLPGFIDTHAHALFTGNVLMNVNLTKATSVDEILELIRQRVEVTPPGEMVKALNADLGLVKEGRLPTLAELDAISVDHPIGVAPKDIHSAMFNTKGLGLLNIPEGTDGVVLDDQGKPTGVLKDPAILYAYSLVVPTDKSKMLETFQVVFEEALKAGVTTLHTKESHDVLGLILDNESALPLRVNPIAFIFKASELEAILKDSRLHGRTTVSLLADGSPFTGTAAFLEPYANDASNYGFRYFSDETLEEMVETVHKAGGQFSIHTCGTRATEQAIQTYERVLEKHPRDDHRRRIEHFEFPLGDHIKRAVSAGVTFAMQPIFLFLEGDKTFQTAVRWLGEQRAERWLPVRTILDHGGLIAGGADSPIAPIDPLAGIQAAVNHHVEKSRPALIEAIRMFTTNAAKIGFEEDTKGKIESGMLADFVVLSADPFQTPIQEISAIQVERAIVGGKTQYQRVDAAKS